MARDLEEYLRPGINSTPFCPGCGHGILMNLILRAIDECKISMNDIAFLSLASVVQRGFQALISMPIPFIPYTDGLLHLQQGQRCSIRNSTPW